MVFLSSRLSSTMYAWRKRLNPMQEVVLNLPLTRILFYIVDNNMVYTCQRRSRWSGHVPYGTSACLRMCMTCPCANLSTSGLCWCSNPVWAISKLQEWKTWFINYNTSLDSHRHRLSFRKRVDCNSCGSSSRWFQIAYSRKSGIFSSSQANGDKVLSLWLLLWTSGNQIYNWRGAYGHAWLQYNTYFNAPSVHAREVSLSLRSNPSRVLG